MENEILYVTNARIPTEKAHGLQIVRTADALSKLGSRVELVLPGRRNPIEGDIFTFYTIQKSFEVRYLSNPLSLLERFVPSVYFPLNRLQFGMRAFLYAAVRTYSAIYTRDILLAFFLSILTTKNVVYEDHEPKKSKRWLYRMLVKSIKKKVVVAKGLEDLYEEMDVDTKSYRWIPNGVSLSDINDISPDLSIWKRTFGIREGTAIVLYTGHFYEWKGVYTLIDAGLALHAENIAIVLIGGSLEELKKVREYIAARGGGTQIYVHGFVPQAEVFQFMKSADVLVLPNTAKEERSAKYTTPIKLFEYMASGVPIVASDIASLRWFLKDGVNSALFKADDVDDLSLKVRQVLSNGDMAKQLGREAVHDAERYTWDTRAKEIITFMQI